MSTDLTFVAWSDPHFGYEPKPPADDLRHRAVRQMIRLPDLPYPAEVGGRVAPPEFILNCGDFVDGPDKELALYHDCMRQIDVPSYETLGNHDIAYPEIVRYFTARYGGRCYSFERGGVHFISLYKPNGELDAVRCDLTPMDREQLDWLDAEFERIGPEKPVVTFSHARVNLLSNPDEVDAVFRKANIVLMLSGHTHLQWVTTSMLSHEWNGRTGVILGHCRDHPIDPHHGRVFHVIRICGRRITVVPWRWDLDDWARAQGSPGGPAEFLSLSY